MVKASWGTKRICPKCTSKFYDLNKKPAHCSACNHEFDPDVTVKRRGKKKTVTVVSADTVEKVKKAVSAQRKKKEEMGEDAEAIGLPAFNDVDVIEDMDDLDDLEDVDTIKGKPAAADDEDEDEEAFMDEDERTPDADDEDEE